MRARLRDTKNLLLILHQIINKKKPDFPSLADEIAEPRPAMDNKVTAFTVSEKSINTCNGIKHKNMQIQNLSLNFCLLLYELSWKEKVRMTKFVKQKKETYLI